MIPAISFPEFTPTTAILRDLPRSFFKCLKEKAPEIPIDVALARRQHETYARILRGLVKNTVTLPADEAMPDCCFIEDTAVVIGDKAAISLLGAPERRGEEIPVREALGKSGIEKFGQISSPGTVDGGDVLFTGKHLIVGISRRTNEAGARQLSEIFGGAYPLVTVPVRGSLHLKSVLSAFDPATIIISRCEAGLRIRESLREVHADYAWVEVPDPVASNVLSVGPTVLVQDGFPRSEAILADLARAKGRRMLKLGMSELIKADGALTCCSLLY